jgi:hypothetical protein
LIWLWLLVGFVVIYLLSAGGGGTRPRDGSGGVARGGGGSRDAGSGGATAGRAGPSKGYRPKPGSPRSNPAGIVFGTENAGADAKTASEQVTDFVTGAAFWTAASTYQCRECLAFYGLESFELLRAENGGRCASCRSTNLRVLGERRSQDAPRATQPSGRAAEPGSATLSNYRSFEGQVVTFCARVVKVKESRRGGDFAVMFEDKAWNLGFKLMFFKNVLTALGGASYARGLQGATITVRGLIVNHRDFGYEIIINDRGMVLRVDR